MHLATQSRRLAFALAILLFPMMPASAADAPVALSEVLRDRMVALENGDFATARRILEPLANSGNTDAQYLLGVMYMRGDGVPQNSREAARLFRLSADHGSKHSQLQFARLLLEGVGVEKDEFEAFRYFELSSRQGFAPAQLALGTLLNPGEFEQSGVSVGANGSPSGDPLAQRIPKDAVMSAHYFRLAAEQGNPDAQFSLGLSFERGLGVPFNSAEAVRLYRLAAKQGHSGAQNNLGAMYSDGEGVKRDHLKAYMWLVIAAAAGASNSTDNRDTMRARMTTRKRAQAEQMAARCLETQFVACD